MNPVSLFPEITAALAATFSGAPHSMVANRQVPRVTVTGEGEKAIPPDMAVSPLSVLGEEKTARAVLDANFEAMTDVHEALRGEGMEAWDLQTPVFDHATIYPSPALDR